MLAKFLAIFLAMSSIAYGADAPVCPKVDTSVKDPDGIPLCPDLVKTDSAFRVFHCAMLQAGKTLWHPPTDPEIANTRALIRTLKDHDYKAILAAADKAKLQACRVIDGDDKYILLFTKAGVKDYNGTFYMFRDASVVSNVTVVSPHVLTDNDHDSSPRGFQHSHARLYVQNGYKKGIGAKPATPTSPAVEGRISDFSHTQNNLGFWAIKAINANFPKQLVLHVHGQADPNSVLRGPVKSRVIDAFDAAILKYTNVKTLKRFNAYYASMDPPQSTDAGYYLKTEIPVRVHLNNPEIVAKIVTEFEKLPEAWGPK